jgi:excisionase family DNA binding protein
VLLNNSELTLSRLLNADEVATILSISKSLAYKLMQNNKIPTVKINRSVRVRETDLNEFIQRSWTGWRPENS